MVPAMPETMFTRDGLAVLATRLAALGTRRVFLISGPNRRFVAPAMAALAGFSPELFDGARVHVPADVVAQAALALGSIDTIVALGGGSAIGLGKALRLSHDVRFAAIPTTYAGSEMTTMYGITRERDKQTGRDPRVRPDLVLYDVDLTRDMPLALTAQSLLNSIAHVASALSTDSLIGDTRDTALAAARDALASLDQLVVEPRSLVAREQAARAASDAAAAFDLGKPGIQHALAHLLGGALGVDHAALHAVLLPRFLDHLRTARPDVLATLEAAVAPELAMRLRDLLARSGAPTELAALGATDDAIRAALATRPELPASIVLAK
jgi:maleylacetate reductase